MTSPIVALNVQLPGAVWRDQVEQVQAHWLSFQNRGGTEYFVIIYTRRGILDPVEIDVNERIDIRDLLRGRFTGLNVDGGPASGRHLSSLSLR